MSFLIDPKSASFEQIKADLEAYLAQKPDSAKWQGFFESQTGQTLVELIAGLGLFMKYNFIVARREAFPRHAQNRSSIIAYAESVGYSAFRGRNAIVTLSVLPNVTGILTKYTVLGAVKDQDLVLLQDTTVNAGVPVNLVCVVGQLKTEDKVVPSDRPNSFRFTQPKYSQDLRVKLNGIEMPISERVLDLNNEKFVVQSNALGAVDVMYINLSTFSTRYKTNDTLQVEYVELKDTQFTTGDIQYNFGTLVSAEVTAVYEAPEDQEAIRINAPLFNETQFVVRGREDYVKIFKLLDPNIVDTSYRDVSPAVVELFYVKRDGSLFSTSEKAALITRLSSNRPMGVQPPLVSHAQPVFLDVDIDVRLKDSSGNPVAEIETVMASLEQVLEQEIKFEDVENEIEAMSFVKIARIKLRGEVWDDLHLYPRGAFVKPLIDNGRVYEMDRILYFSGPIQPAFPTTLGGTVQDNDLLWQNCGELGPCDSAEAWEPNTAYELGAAVQPVVPNGFVYCLVEQLNISGFSSEVQAIGFSATPDFGTFRLEFNGEETTNLPFSASAQDVANALNALNSLSSVEVTGNTAVGFEVAFKGADANKPQPQITLLSQGRDEVNCVNFDLTPNQGQWRLRFRGDVTASLPYNITIAQLKQALESLPSIGVGNVDVQVGTAGDEFRIIFTGTLGKQNLPDSVELAQNTLVAATPITVTPSTTQEGRSPFAGQNEIQRIDFTLVPDTGTWSINFNGKTTSLLQFNADAAAIQAALSALSTVGLGNVSVSGSYAVGYTVQFLNTLGLQNVPLMTIPSNTLQLGTQLVDVDVAVPQEGAAPDPGTDEVQHLAFNFVPDAGSFKLQYGAEQSLAIPYTASALDVQNAINNMAALSGCVVTGNFTSGFTIQFSGVDAKMDHPQLEIAENLLSTSSAPVTASIIVCVEGQLPAQNLKIGGSTGAAVTVNVSTTSDASNPEPNWAAAVGIEEICP